MPRRSLTPFDFGLRYVPRLFDVYADAGRILPLLMMPPWLRLFDGCLSYAISYLRRLRADGDTFDEFTDAPRHCLLYAAPMMPTFTVYVKMAMFEMHCELLRDDAFIIYAHAERLFTPSPKMAHCLPMLAVVERYA